MSSASPASPAGRSSGVANDILDAFEEQAARVGIRAVVMAELAAGLRMSTKTLYRHYPTKVALVDALVRRWVDTLLAEQEQRIATEHAPVARIQAAARSGFAHIWRFCPTFWEDLERDYPEQDARYRSGIAASFGRAAAWLDPELRPGLPITLAAPLLIAVLERATDPELCDELGVSRPDAIDAAVEIWANGALRPAGHLVVMPRRRGERGDSTS